jgi:hypothetical protein
MQCPGVSPWSELVATAQQATLTPVLWCGDTTGGKAEGEVLQMCDDPAPSSFIAVGGANGRAFWMQKEPDKTGAEADRN